MGKKQLLPSLSDAQTTLLYLTTRGATLSEIGDELDLIDKQVEMDSYLALQKVGRRSVPPSSFMSAIEIRRAEATLTHFEDKLVELVATGYEDREIAIRLNTSEQETRSRIMRLLRKLHLASRIELVFWVCSQTTPAEEPE